MKTIYLDSNFCCHVTNDGTMTSIETDFFDDKCDTFVEGYRYIPDGQSWTNEKGTKFKGQMIAPWRDFLILDTAQQLYEQQQLLAEYSEALKILGVEL